MYNEQNCRYIIREADPAKVQNDNSDYDDDGDEEWKRKKIAKEIKNWNITWCWWRCDDELAVFVVLIGGDDLENKNHNSAHACVCVCVYVYVL